MTRAFVAVRPPDVVLDAVGALSLDLGDAARMTTRAQWHATLQFLGNHADIDAVEHALSGLSVAQGDAQLGGAGAFPNARRARVVWLGFAHGASLLGELASEVARLVEPIGFVPEVREYHAHLTLARLRVPARLHLPTADVVGPVWTVDEVVLYESRLSRSGAEYVARAVFPLRPADARDA